MSPAAIPVAMLAAALFAASWALQHVAARQEERAELFDPRLLMRLFRRPVWLLGRVAATVGVGVQFLALRLGPLSVVAPLMVFGLVIAVPMEALLTGRRPDRAETNAVGITGFGIALFVYSAHPHRAHAQPGVSAWVGVIGTAALVVAACAALHAVSERWSAAALGTATGVMFGLAAALLKAAATRASSAASLLSDPRLYLYVGVSVFAMILTQNAFQQGRLSTPLIAITLSEPVTALLIGVIAFDEHVRMGPARMTAAAAGAVMIAVGVRRLTALMNVAQAHAAASPHGQPRTAP
ncbi:MAG TPA: DMT family transporter [Sporichthyaceae bacterium]|jgi:drug/metabolite transporter (DMT)-like permease|nr:DMT family transporter [Sporichthyaceae bacterium]